MNVRINDNSPADLAKSVWNGGASKVYSSKEAFVTELAQFYARKTGATKVQAHKIRQKMADAIAPNEEMHFDGPVVLADGGDESNN